MTGLDSELLNIITMLMAHRPWTDSDYESVFDILGDGAL